MIINVNGVSREMTEEEEERFDNMIVDEVPTQLDAIEAQVLYTAMMTDTLIED
jgi:hypothetical protein